MVTELRTDRGYGVKEPEDKSKVCNRNLREFEVRLIHPKTYLHESSQHAGEPQQPSYAPIVNEGVERNREQFAEMALSDRPLLMRHLLEWK